MRLPANTGKGISRARSRINQLGITQPLDIRPEKLNASKTNLEQERQMEHLVDRIGCKKEEGVREGKNRYEMHKLAFDTKCCRNSKRILNSEATPLVTLRVSAIHRTDLKTFCYNLE